MDTGVRDIIEFCRNLTSRKLRLCWKMNFNFINYDDNNNNNNNNNSQNWEVFTRLANTAGRHNCFVIYYFSAQSDGNEFEINLGFE